MPFSRYCSSKLQFFFYFSVAISPVLWQKINFWNADLHVLEKQLISNSWPFYFVLTTTMPKTLIDSSKHAVTFELLHKVGNPGEISKAKKRF